MRKFNSVEQSIINKIVASRQNETIQRLSFGDIICNEMKDKRCFSIEWKTDPIANISLYYTEMATARNVFFHFLDIMTLFKYLEENGLIYISKMSNSSNEKAIYNHNEYKREEKNGESEYYDLRYNGNKIKLHDNKVFEISSCHIIYNKMRQDSNVALLLDRYAHSIIYPTYTLQLYVKNEYMTDEELRHNEQMNAMQKQIELAQKSFWWAIGIAIISLIVSFLSAVITCK